LTLVLRTAPDHEPGCRRFSRRALRAAFPRFPKPVRNKILFDHLPGVLFGRNALRLCLGFEYKSLLAGKVGCQGHGRYSAF
jgi:hypothetical protein